MASDGTAGWVNPANLPWMFGDEERYDCPNRPWLDDQTGMSFLYDAYAHYQNGFLLEEGAVLDQPAKLMKLLAVMSSQMVLCDEERRTTEREREEARRRAAEMAKERDARGGR